MPKFYMQTARNTGEHTSVEICHHKEASRAEYSFVIPTGGMGFEKRPPIWVKFFRCRLTAKKIIYCFDPLLDVGCTCLQFAEFIIHKWGCVMLAPNSEWDEIIPQLNARRFFLLVPKFWNALIRLQLHCVAGGKNHARCFRHPGRAVAFEAEETLSGACVLECASALALSG